MKASDYLRLAIAFSVFALWSEYTFAGPKEQCIDKLVTGTQGRGPTTQDLSAGSKEALVDALLADPRFIEKFARHVNDYFNDSVAGASDEANAPYYLAKKILADKLPWSDMFQGPWAIRTEGAAPNARVVISNDPNQLGYFTNLQWNIRYEGGEGEGFQLRKAYRIPHNMVGLRLPPVDAQGKDRKDPTAVCYACHFEPKNIYALDLIAQALPKKLFANGTPQSGQYVNPVYAKPEDAPDVLLVKDLSGLKAIVGTLLGDKFKNDYNFNLCRMSFQFFYHRNEADNTLDFKQFDACMSALETTPQNIRAAVKGLAMAPEFCAFP